MLARRVTIELDRSERYRNVCRRRRPGDQRWRISTLPLHQQLGHALALNRMRRHWSPHASRVVVLWSRTAEPHGGTRTHLAAGRRTDPHPRQAVSYEPHSRHARYAGVIALVLASFFFFSSRRRHTRSDRDWSSDVCSSDLVCREHHALPARRRIHVNHEYADEQVKHDAHDRQAGAQQRDHRGERDEEPKKVTRSEERRVGKECRSRWSPYH